MIVYEHSYSFSTIVASVAFAVLVGMISVWRLKPRSWLNGLLFSLHALALGALGWCLLVPGIRNETVHVRKPRFLIGLDTSQSMTLSAAPDIPSRWSTVQKALHQPWLERISAECEVHFYTFHEELSESTALADAAALKPEGTASRLRSALSKMQDESAGLHVAGMLLLSDGADTSEALDDWAALPRPFPIFTLRPEPPGGWRKDPDVRIDAVTTSRRVTRGWKSELKVKISGQGTRSAPVPVQLFKDGTLLSELPAPIPDEGGEREVIFELEHPQMGIFNYRVFLPPFEGEKNLDDNEQKLSVEVVDARNRLLYVEGTPRWEYKYLRRVLLSQQQVSPVIFFTGPDGAQRGGTPVGNITAELSASQLAYFKIILLGNVDANELGAERARNLLKFVEDGGSLILLGGAKGWTPGGLPETELGKALPVRGSTIQTLEGEKPFAVKLSDAARSHPAFAGDAELWQNIPPVLSVFSGFTLAPAAETLVSAITSHGEQPLIATQRFGQGKVSAILTDSLWRWQLDPDAGKTRPYERFWTQMIAWLLPREESLDGLRLELFTENDQLFLGQTLQVHARFSGLSAPKLESIQAQITLPDGRTVPYQMNAQLISLPSGKSFSGFSLAFTTVQPGLHKISATAHVSGKEVTSDPFDFYVKPYFPETIPRPAKVELLQALATSSGGQFFESGESLNAGLSKLPVHVFEEKLSDHSTLWRQWRTVIALMTLTTAAWTLRRVRNMP